jgi:plasmid maintenance system antidote protein VapI
MSKSKATKTKRETIAETLRRKIAERETIAEVACGARIAVPVLWRFATGKRDLTLRTADKLLKYLDLEIRDKTK